MLTGLSQLNFLQNGPPRQSMHDMATFWTQRAMQLAQQQRAGQAPVPMANQPARPGNQGVNMQPAAAPQAGGWSLDAERAAAQQIARPQPPQPPQLQPRNIPVQQNYRPVQPQVAPRPIAFQRPTAQINRPMPPVAGGVQSSRGGAPPPRQPLPQRATAQPISFRRPTSIQTGEATTDTTEGTTGASSRSRQSTRGQRGGGRARQSADSKPKPKPRTRARVTRQGGKKKQQRQHRGFPIHSGQNTRFRLE